MVDAVQRIGRQTARAGEKPRIGFGRPFTRRHGGLIAAAAYEDVTRHVMEMTAVGRISGKRLGRGQRSLRRLRHLPGMDDHVRDMGMRAAGVPSRSL